MLTLEMSTQELSRLSAAFNRKLTDEQQAVYFDAIKTLDYNLFKGAVALCILNSKYFPSVAEIISNYKIMKDDYNRDHPALVGFVKDEDVKIDGKNISTLCKKLLSDFELGLISRETFKIGLIDVEKKLMDAGKLPVSEFNKCVNRIQEILK